MYMVWHPRHLQQAGYTICDRMSNSLISKVSMYETAAVSDIMMGTKERDDRIIPVHFLQCGALET